MRSVSPKARALAFMAIALAAIPLASSCGNPLGGYSLKDGVTLGSGGSHSTFPLTIANLTFWADASQLSAANGAKVATWNDLSGQGNNATQATAGNQPTFKTSQVNALPVVEFDGATSYLDFTTPIPLQPATICVVGKYLNSVQAPYLGDEGTTAFMGYSGVSVFYYSSNASESFARATPTAAFEAFCAVVAAAGGTTDLRFNGVSGGTSGALNYGGSTFAHIGRRTAERINAQIAEITVYSRALSATEVSNLENYLIAKYSLP